jgi:thimet oligopeptidase
MKNVKRLIVFLSAIPAIVSAQNPRSTNPLLVHSNTPIAFDKVNAAACRDAVGALIKVSDQRIEQIAAIPPSKKTLNNTLMAFDELQYDLTDLGNKLGVVAATYSDDSTRNEANKQLQKISSYGSDLFLNAPLYHALKQFSASAAAKQLSQHQSKFLRETLVAFEINGMKLDAQGKKKLKGLNDKLSDFGNPI